MLDEVNEAKLVQNEAKTDKKRKNTDVTVLSSSSFASSVVEDNSVKKSKISSSSKSLGELLSKTEKTGTKGAPITGSLSTILSQGLHSNDSRLIEYVLSESAKSVNVNVIKNTVARLPQHLVVSAAQMIVDKMSHSPSSSSICIKWLQAILLQHHSLLLSSSSTATASLLYQLSSVIDVRLSVFKKLMTLSGRLELLMATLNRRSVVKGEESNGPLAVFNERDGDEQTQNGGDDEEINGDDEIEVEDEDDDEDDDGDDDDDGLIEDEVEADDGKVDESGSSTD